VEDPPDLTDLRDAPEPTLPPPGRRCGVYETALLLTLAGLYACWCQAPLIWDGAAQFSWTLLHQVPYAYGGWRGRFHSGLVWLPVVAASKATSDMGILQTIYGLPFVLAPAVGLLLSWWVVKRHAPGLILWAAFGIAAAPLPGQIFIINDSIFQQHLFWPVFLGALVPLTPGRRLVLTLLALLQLSQPIGLVLLVGAAGAAAILGLLDERTRRRQLVRAGLLLGLGVLAFLKVRFLQDDLQASAEMTWLEVMKRWHVGVEGSPLMGLTFMWAAAGLVFARGWVGSDSRRQGLGRLLGVGALACALAGGAVWVAWASDERHWRLALDYRRWLLPLTFPFFLLALWEAYLYAVRPAPDASHAGPAKKVLRLRAQMSHVLAGVYAAVLIIQCTLWLAMLRRLMNDVNAYPAALVPRSAVPWVEETALNHWTLPSVVAAMQGRRQEKVLLFEPEWEGSLRQDPPRVPLSEWERWPIEPGPAGWFDFRPFFENYRRTKRPP
jgi:hypothetical protein